MPDPQLLTKQIIEVIGGATGITKTVRFNLQRGKIARIWGFSYGIFGDAVGTREYTLFVRKTQGSTRRLTPEDLLWQHIRTTFIGGTDHGFTVGPTDVFFPKPHRTPGITVQMHCTVTTTARGLLIIYYDIDDVVKGELVQAWEKNVLKGRTRRAISP